MSSLSTSLKNSYQRWLFPYEEYLRLAKPGVHQQLEYEYGGPLTPSPANSPMKKSHQNTPSSLRGASPAIRASDALNGSMKDEFERTMKNIPMLESPARPIFLPVAPAPTPTPVSSGFTPVNAGGFTPVNAAPATFTPVNISRRDREESGFAPTRRPFDSPLSSAKNTPEYRPSGLSSAPVVNGFTSNPLLKRQLSHDSLDSRRTSQPPDDSEKEGRRSKRLKKGMRSIYRNSYPMIDSAISRSGVSGMCSSACPSSFLNWRQAPRLMIHPADAVPTVAGSHMTLFRPTPPRIPGGRGPSAPGEVSIE